MHFDKCPQQQQKAENTSQHMAFLRHAADVDQLPDEKNDVGPILVSDAVDLRIVTQII